MDFEPDRGLLPALAGIALLLAAALIAYRPPGPLAADAAPAAFSAYRTQAILKDLVGNDLPHPIGSPDNGRVRDAIVRRLTALGYAPGLQWGFVCDDEGVCGSPINIVATLGGTSPGADAVMLAAHYDSVPAGPGASDDGAGVASVLEIARILAGMAPLPHPIVLLLTDGEEAGLLGAKLFVREHPLAKQVRAAVNLEARGTSGPSLMFETGTANTWLMRLYRSAVARPITNSIYSYAYRQLPNDTDFTLFKDAGYQGFNFAFIGDVDRYHTPLDTAANVTLSSIQHQGDNALAALLALENSGSLRPHVSESVFFDLFARGLAAWPAAFTLPAAVLALILLAAEATLLLRKRVVTGRQILWGCVGALVNLTLAPLLCIGLLAFLNAVGKAPMDGATLIAHPLPMTSSAAALAFLAAGAAAALTPRAGFWGFWAAAALLMALLSVALATLAPGMSYVVLLPAVAAGLAALPCVLDLVRARAQLRRAVLAALVPLLVIFAAMLPVLRFMYTALGSVAWPILTLTLSLATITLLPLLAAAARRGRRRVILTSAATAVAGVLLTLGLPVYTAAAPERINLAYLLDADTHQAHWVALPNSPHLPKALAAAARFDTEPRSGFLGSSAPAFYAVASAIALAAPELTVMSRTALPAPGSTSTSRADASSSAPDAVRYRLRLRSPRGAPEALVIFAASAHIRDITGASAAGPWRAKLHPMKNGATLLDVVGLPAAGMEFCIKASAQRPVAARVFDESYRLPEGEFLQDARPSNATSSQRGDTTVVQRTVSLAPRGRPQ